MPRRTRIDAEGGWHHVMNRGAARQAVFMSARDGRTFLHYLGETTTRLHAELHAYCLMTNHFHLLVRFPEGGLSRFMHSVAARYVRYFNDVHGRDGPIFRSRFHSISLDTPTYVKTVGRYIHRNPLDVRPAIALDQYPWSSYRHYVRSEPPPEWLTVATLLGEHQGVAGYREFVQGGEGGGDWRWAIEVAIDELVDEPVRPPSLFRTAAVALFDIAGPELRHRIEADLAFPTPQARTMALLRMARRAARDALIPAVAARALQLAS